MGLVMFGPDFYTWHRLQGDLYFWSMGLLERPWAWPLFHGLAAPFPYLLLTYLIEMLTQQAVLFPFETLLCCRED